MGAHDAVISSIPAYGRGSTGFTDRQNLTMRVRIRRELEFWSAASNLARDPSN